MMEPKINLFEFFLQAMTALFFIAIAVMQWQRSVRRNTHRRGTRRTVSPELTVTNVMEYIDRNGVSKKWKQLGEELCGKSAELDKVSSLSAMIEFWLSHSRTTPSWRSLVWALDAISETSAAEDLMDICESSQDTTVTVENLSSVLYIVAPEKRESIWHDLHFPSHRLRAINLSGVEDCTYESITYYVSCCPDLSVVWRDLYCSLYRHEELPALDKVKEFCCITQNSLFTVENIAAIMTEWAPEDFYTAFASGDQPLLPHSQLDIVLKQYDTMEERCRACAEYCVNYNSEYYLYPDDVWNKLALRMNEAGASQESVMIVEAIKERFAAEQKDDSEILPPIIIKHPKDLSKVYGEDVTLNVAIINSGMLSYQWIKDEKDIESDKFDGHLTSTLKIKSFTPEYVGSYKCRVSNEARSVDSKCGQIRDGSPLLELKKNGYVCIAHNLLGFLYQPENVQTQKIELKVINDKDCYPITKATEILLTPIVQLTSCDISTMNPSIVELMKIASLSDNTDSKPLTVVVLFSPDGPQEWKELGVRLDESKVLNCDRISFEASRLGYYAVVIRFPLPSASAVVVPNHKVELKVPDLPGFKLEVPPESIEAGTEIQTIIHFDGPMLSIEADNTPQASPCIEIRPHGQKFSEEVLIEIPIPRYTEIMNKHAEAKLQLYHSPSDPSENAMLKWTIHDKQIKISDDKGENNITALVYVNHSGEIMYKWKANDIETFDKDTVSTYYKKRADLIKGRCTVLMSEVLLDESIDEFLIAAYVYPFCEEGYNNLEYPYSLYDSGNLPVDIKVGNLTYDIELMDYLSSYKATESAMFLGECCSLVQFHIPNDTSKLRANTLLGRIFLKDSRGQELQRFYLKMPRCSRGKSIAAEEPRLIVISVSSAVVADLEECPQLNIKNLNTIMNSFWLARARWFNIGLCIGLEFGDLLAIERSPPFDVDGCFLRMLAQWLNHTKPIPTWIALRHALESKTVNVKLVVQEEGKPRVIKQPLTLSMSYGDEATFTVVATGTEPLMYQWKSNGNQVIRDSKRIFGVRTNTLRIRQLQLEHTGVYTCIITNDIGQIESEGAVLSLKPKVTESPMSLKKSYSEEAIFTVSAIGSQPLHFQWMKDEKDIIDNEKYRGAKTNRIIIQSLDSKDVACYTCMVKNPFGEDISEGAKLILKLEIIEQPLSVKSHCSSDTIFDVTAVGSDPLSYQWKKENKNITDNDTYAGAMTSKLTIRYFTINHMGVYSCTIKDQFGKCESDEATLIIEHSKACFQNLLELLDLTKHYPQKLTLHKAVCLRSETLGKSKCTDPKKLSLFVLQHIMAYSSQCRSNLLSSPQHESTNEDCDSSSDDEAEYSGDEEVEYSGKIHPMDNILALLHCADDFLRQYLMARLVTCQLSIPFILPDPSTGQLTLLLWAMKSIVKEWRGMINGNAIKHQGPLISYPAPTVAFVRFSKQERSKSAIMNEVISDSYLDSFFHRDREEGKFIRHLGEGLVDLCWYLPEPNDTFPDAVAFFNLHGDARKHPKQMEFFSKFCFMSFILLSEEDIDKESIVVLKTLSVAPGGIVLLLCSNVSSEKVHQLEESIPHEKRIDCKITRKNMDEIKRTVRSQIRKKLGEVHYNRDSLRVQTIEDCKNIAHKCNICTDEEKAEINEAKRLARQICDMISENVMHAKANLLPLQGMNLWQRWAEKDKEQHRQRNRGSIKSEVYIDEMDACKKKLRQLQLEEVRKPSSMLMEHFLTSIMQCDKSTRNYFLQYLRLLLNDLSNTALSKLRHEYNEEQNKLVKLDNDRDHQASTVEDCKRTIEMLSDQIAGATFRLEDFFRELGQVYEATYQTSMEHKYQNLPRLAAELLIDGNPLELMDGDAVHVPIQWIEAVMQEVVQLLHNPKVFIISVIGLASTGKSTILNTIFGLQLNVCTVRGTKGAFMQLLPLCDSLRKEAKCDYVLVVDTEGLRDVGVDKLSHDSQLATFIVGLADLTLINIYGEVPGDMDDILEVTICALLHMKSLKLKPSCLFVHQNCSVIAVRGMGHSRFKDKLDYMTRLAAKDEECESRFQVFNDIINFDTEYDIHHLPCLWRGDPPMAPVNERYSCTALRLKTHLVDKIKRQGSRQLSAIKVRLRNLWNAILQENYIFDFRNHLEITAHKDLDAKIIKWEHQLGTEVYRWEDEQALRISQLDEDDLKAFKKQLFTKYLPEMMQHISEEINSHMVHFFEESQHADLLIQWKCATEFRLNSLQHELQDNAGKYLKGLIESKQLRDEFKHNVPKYHAQLSHRVKCLSAKGNLTLKNDLKPIFDEEWEMWLADLRSMLNMESVKLIDTEEAVECCLMNHFKYDQSKVISRLRDKPLKMWGTCLELKEEPTHEHISLKQQTTSHLMLHQSALTAMQIQLIKSTAKDAFRNVEEYLQSIQDKHFRPCFTQEILDIVAKVIDSSSSRMEFTFTKDYRIAVSLTACGYAVRQFEKMVNDFSRQIDPILYLETEMKDDLFIYFKNLYFQLCEEKIAASEISKVLADSIERYITDSLGIDIVQGIRSSQVQFHSKSSLIAKILFDLGEHIQEQSVPRLDDYFLYLSDVKRSLQLWIKRYVFNYCNEVHNGEKRLVFYAKRMLSDILNKVLYNIRRQKLDIRSNSGIKEWLSQLLSSCGLDIDTTEIRENLMLSSCSENFTEILQNEILTLQDKLQTKVQKITVDELEKGRCRPHDILYGTVCGCTAQCPFCREVCAMIDPEHSVNISHHCLQHRPSCLGGNRHLYSGELNLDVCNSLVASDQISSYSDTNRKVVYYRDYQAIYPNWSITPDMSASVSIYWKWFLGRYSMLVARHFVMKDTQVPSSWRNLRWNDVAQELKREHNL